VYTGVQDKEVIMSYYDYKVGLQISAKDYPFYALIQAAMRQADTDNFAKLKEAFPKVWADLDARYHAPGGVLPGERIAIEGER
jgi:hypothetical protein